MSIDISAINSYHIHNVDKHYRMFAGLSSQLLDFQNDTLYLEISISRRWAKDVWTTAIQIANDWKKVNKELASARYYQVTIQFLDTKYETGGAVATANQSDHEIATRIYHIMKATEAAQKEQHQKIVLTGSIDEPINHHWSNLNNTSN